MGMKMFGRWTRDRRSKKHFDHEVIIDTTLEDHEWEYFSRLARHSLCRDSRRNLAHASRRLAGKRDDFLEFAQQSRKGGNLTKWLDCFAGKFHRPKSGVGLVANAEPAGDPPRPVERPVAYPATPHPAEPRPARPVPEPEREYTPYIDGDKDEDESTDLSDCLDVVAVDDIDVWDDIWGDVENEKYFEDRQLFSRTGDGWRTAGRHSLPANVVSRIE